MATSLIFNNNVKHVLPVDILEKHRILPIAVHEDKLCLIARRPLSNEALLELKDLTGFEDYELQIVGEDVIDAYLMDFKSGDVFKIAA